MVESMQRTLRGRHSVRRELRIFEILEALLAREIIERSSFATPPSWIGSIQSSIEGHYDKNKIVKSRLKFNFSTWFFSKFFLRNCSIKYKLLSYEIYEIIIYYLFIYISLLLSNCIFFFQSWQFYRNIFFFFFAVFSYHLAVISVNILHGISFEKISSFLHSLLSL